MVRVKVCGITNEEDALKAARLGAWALGFIFYRKSPRYIKPAAARKIIRRLPPFVTPVGVFVNEKEEVIKRIADTCGIRTLQFHGEETPGFLRNFKEFRTIKAFRILDKLPLKSLSKYHADAFLFDTFKKGIYGGTGEVFNWALFKEIESLERPLILSGGLHAGNIREAVRKVNPFAVDISSGVERSPGKKDHRLLKEFLALCHA
jgi:phosphoribosylanthranilate isomerase